MLINRTKDSANSWCKQGENRKVKIWRESRITEEEVTVWRWGQRGQQANPRGVLHSRLSPQPASFWPYSAHPSTGTDLGEQNQEKSHLQMNQEHGKGCSWPLFWSSRLSLGNFKPTPIRVLLPIASFTCTLRDHLRFLNLFEHLFWSSSLLNGVDGSISLTWSDSYLKASFLSSGFLVFNEENGQVSWQIVRRTPLFFGFIFLFFSFFYSSFF